VYASKRCNDGNLSEKIQCNCLEGKPSAKPKGSECLAPPSGQLQNFLLGWDYWRTAKHL